MTADANPISPMRAARSLPQPLAYDCIHCCFCRAVVAGGFFQHAAKQHPQATSAERQRRAPLHFCARL